jgi:hypothetical protein
MDLTQKNSLYLCEKCNFKTGNKNDYSRHLLTAKHKIKTNIELLEQKALCCDICKKTYNSRNSLWYHKKKCEKTQKTPEKTPDANALTLKKMEEIMMLAFQQNKALVDKNMELAQKMLEIASEPKTITHTNSHNKQFNLNFYLNDTCKNAINMGDFVNSLQIDTEELENVGKLGYVEGFSNIFIRGLKDLDETKRPMHCLDKKRETLYIKDNGSWNKDEKQDRIKEVIGLIAHKNFMKLMQWKDENPQHENPETKKHAQYVELVKQVFTGITPEDDNGINKIIRKVASEVCVDKGSTAIVFNN